MKRISSLSLLLPLAITLLLPGCWPFGQCGNYPQPTTPQQEVTAEVAIGELIDKMTILQIKTERISDPKKLKNVKKELAVLQDTYDKHVVKSEKLVTLEKKLLETNKKLWDIEDYIREEERKQEFGEQFVKLARSVYYTNDERCEIKRDINKLLGSNLMEEKSYQDYKTA